ncbi:unnamed protein product, partial [Ectocarpus sp. 8 AP-2014]
TRWTWTSVVACEPLESLQQRTGWIRQFPLLCCRKLLLPERRTRLQRQRCHQQAGARCRRVPQWCQRRVEHGRESQTPPPWRWTMQEGRLFRQAAPRVRHRPRPWSALAARRLLLRAGKPAWTGAWEPFLRASCPLIPRR